MADEEPGQDELRDPSGSAPPPASVEEALARARTHGRAAVGESLEMLRALVDAAALATSGEPSEMHRLLGPLAKLLEGLAERMDVETRSSSLPLLEAVADALDAEIQRWEERARDNPDARAVLRAFLGLRELLWEFGVRRPGPAPEPSQEAPEVRKPRSSRRSRVKRRPRIQRVPVQG